MNEELILGTSSKGIKMDLLRFKDDILKDMRNIAMNCILCSFMSLNIFLNNECPTKLSFFVV